MTERTHICLPTLMAEAISLAFGRPIHGFVWVEKRGSSGRMEVVHTSPLPFGVRLRRE